MNPIVPVVLLVLVVSATFAPWRRPGWTAPSRAVAIELIGLCLALLVAVWLGDRVVAPRWLRPWRELVLLAAAYWYAVAGGSVIVRMVLDLVPAGERPGRDGITVPAAELSRGRIIGMLERAVALTLILLGQFGLIVAAKALARFKALDDRGFAEYFLIGTLASLLHALVVGAATRLLL